jgi:hypothetical protein
MFMMAPSEFAFLITYVQQYICRRCLVIEYKGYFLEPSSLLGSTVRILDTDPGGFSSVCIYMAFNGRRRVPRSIAAPFFST